MRPPAEQESRADRAIKIKIDLDTDDAVKGIGLIVTGMKKIRREVRQNIHALREFERAVNSCGQGDSERSTGNH